MQDAVNAVADRLDLRQIGQLGRLELLVGAEIGGFRKAVPIPPAAPVINMRGISSLCFDRAVTSMTRRRQCGKRWRATQIRPSYPAKAGVSSNRRRQCLLDHPLSRIDDIHKSGLACRYAMAMIADADL